MWIMVAGPYRSGARAPADLAANLHALNQAAYEAFLLGHQPILGVNLALGIIAAAGDQVYDEVMMPVSLEAATRCDAILRIGGPSDGADQEVERFKARGLPVFYDLEALRTYQPVQAVAAGRARRELAAALDHVALLVGSVAEALDRVAPIAGPGGPINAFPGEGTRESYVGDDAAAARLLLVEPAGDGPYQRAYQERGPGLHHVGLAVEDLEGFIGELGGSGWYLLPQALDTLSTSSTAWLGRPGVPLLLEVTRDPGWRRKLAASRIVERVEVPVPPARPDLISALGVPGLAASEGNEVSLTISGKRYHPRALQ